MADRRFGDVGGTSGGLGDFLLGFALTCVGAYLLTNQVIVAGSYWNFWGSNTFGITLIPMLIGAMEMTTGLLNGNAVMSDIRLLIVFDVIFTSLAIYLIDFILVI